MASGFSGFVDWTGLTWGAGGAAPPAHDADRPELLAYTLTGGTIGRALTEDRVGHWLLDVDFGGVQWRFSDAEVTPASRDDNLPRVYVTGLSAIDFDLGGESISVAIRASSSSVWATETRRLGPMRQRPFVLRRWYAGFLEDALVVLQGVVDSAQWADPGDPAALTLSLRRSLRELSIEVCPSLLSLTEGTDGAWDSVEPGNFGELYPIVLGFPGESGFEVPSGDATPAFVIRQPTLPHLLIAGHHVAAVQVHVWDESAQSNLRMDVQNQFDNLGRPVATTDPFGQNSGSVGDASAEITVGWSRDAAWGGGLSHRGEVIDGLGDVLRWGCETRSRAVYDRGEMESRRRALNRFRVSCVINEPGLLWQDWLSRNLLDTYELEEVHGPRGIYYVEQRFVTDATELRGVLTTDSAIGGHHVQRASAVVEEQDEIANEITVQYAPARMSTSTYRRRTTVGALLGSNQAFVGNAYVNYAADTRCMWSRHLYGAIPRTFSVATTWDDGTGALIAQTKVARHALPRQLVSYDGGKDLLDYARWDTVALHDASPGADFRGDLAIVLGLTLLEGDAVRIHLRVPLDPMRRPTVSPP